MKNQQILILFLIIVTVGTAAFFGGMKYQEAKAVGPNGGRQLQGMGGREGFYPRGSGQGPALRNGGAVLGDIIASDDKSITVKLQDGSSKIVLLPDNVTLSKTDTATKTDLKTGVRVGVFGTANPDGSVTAQNIQLNPMFRMRSGGATPSSSPY